MTEDGVVLTKIDDLKKEASSYYKRFLQGSPERFEEVPMDIMSNLIQYRCSVEDAAELIQPVDGEET